MSTPRDPSAPLGALADSTDAAADERRHVLAELHRDHYRSLVRLACLLVDRQELAEEIVQDAFVQLHGSLDRISDPSARPAYLRSIVMNRARSSLRHRLVVQKHVHLPEVAGAGADVAAVLSEDQREVIEALRTLPTRQRECLVLRFYGECNEAETAEALGISVGSVKTHVSRAMAAMTKRLEGRR